MQPCAEESWEGRGGAEGRSLFTQDLTERKAVNGCPELVLLARPPASLVPPLPRWSLLTRA